MVPDNLDTNLDTAFIYVTGGSNDRPGQQDPQDDELILMATMAQQTATVTVRGAVLRLCVLPAITRSTESSAIASIAHKLSAGITEACA